MATRTINTKLVIEGEAEYRQALKNCNSELAAMKSQLELVESQYKNQENSLGALQAKEKALTDIYAKQQEKVQTLQGALENAQKAQRAYSEKTDECRAKLAAATKQMEEMAGGSGNAKEAQEKLAAEIKQLSEELQKAEKDQQGATRGVNDWQKQLNYAQKDLIGFDAELKNNDRFLDEAKNSTDQHASSIDAYGKEIKQLSTDVQNAGKDSKDFGVASTAAVESLSSVLIASGVAAKAKELAETLRECVDSASAFEKGMAEVYTLLPGLSKRSQDQLSGDMMKFSSEMNVMTTDSVPALYQAISAGVPKENVFSFLETAQKAAVGGVTNMETAVDGLTSIVNAYGESNINASQTADMMFTAVKLGKTNFEELSGSIYNVVPTAAAAKIGFGDVAASLAVITAQGVPTNVATTQLRQMFVELADSGSQVSKSFEEVSGTSFKQFIASGGNVQQALQKLEEHAAQSGIGVNELFSSVEAGNASLQLTGQATESFTNALEAMKNSTGAADAAYETMTQTAEYASQRAQVALENVKTSVGNVLLPAFAELQNVGADVMTWAAEIIEKNPVIIELISGVAAAAVALAGGIAIYTAVTKLAKLASDAFNGSLLSNPIGIAIIAVSALAGALVTLGTAFAHSSEDGQQSFRELTAASREAKETIAESKKAYDETAESTVAAADVAKKYVGRLDELKTQGLKTKEAQMEYAGIVEKLNGLMPDLNLTINEQTGLLDQNTNSVLANIDSLKEQALAQARMEKNQEIMKAWTDAVIEQEENQRALNVAKAEEEEATRNQTAANEAAAALAEEINKQRQDEIDQYGEAITASVEYNQEYLNLLDSAQAYGDAAWDAQDRQKTLNKAIDEGAETVSAAEAEVDGYSEAQQEASDSSQGMAEDTAALEDAAKKAAEKIKELKKRHTELTDATRKLSGAMPMISNRYWRMWIR